METILLQAGYRVEIDEAKTAPLARPPQPLVGQTTGIPAYPCYRTVEGTHADLAQLAADHPGLVSWIDIGNSWEKVTPGGPGSHFLASPLDASVVLKTACLKAGVSDPIYRQ